VNQLDFFTDFDGATYDPERDRDRLTAQIRRVYTLMRDGQWRTLSEISQATGDPEASVSARLRDLRKPKWGGYLVERHYVTRGLWQYRVNIQ